MCIKKLINWFKSSNRYKHLLYGMIIGIFADDTYCAQYTGFGIASALEYKDKAWGGKWDWIDWSLTITGVEIGMFTRIILTKWITH